MGSISLVFFLSEVQEQREPCDELLKASHISVHLAISIVPQMLERCFWVFLLFCDKPHTKVSASVHMPEAVCFFVCVYGLN